MKLPDRHLLREKEHKFLYEHDIMEIHNPDINSFEYQRYTVRVSEIISAIIRYIPEGRKVAEIGCAQGNISLLLAEKGYRVFAVDIQHSFLAYMMMKYEKGKLFPIVGNAESLPFVEESLDAIIVAELLEHVIYPHKILLEAHRVLKKRDNVYYNSKRRIHKEFSSLLTKNLRLKKEHHSFYPMQMGIFLHFI